MEKIRYSINLLIVFLMLLTIAVNRDGKVLGTPVQQLVALSDTKEQPPVEIVLEDGTRVINSASIAKDIAGFGGATPLKMYLRGDTISRIELSENNETPDFLAAAIEKGVLTQWIGVSPQEATIKEVDAVSGATLTSTALNQTIKRAATFAAQAIPATNTSYSISLKNIVGLLVVADSYRTPFFREESKLLHISLPDGIASGVNRKDAQIKN